MRPVSATGEVQTLAAALSSEQEKVAVFVELKLKLRVVLFVGDVEGVTEERLSTGAVVSTVQL